MGALLQNTVFGRSKNSFVSTWRSSNTSAGSSTATQVRLPLVSSGTYNFTVDWGDGSSSKITAWNQSEITHTYAAAGDYTIKISGVCTGWSFNNAGDRTKITSIKRWGILNFSLSQNHFYGCNQMDLSQCEDAPNFGTATSLINSFRNCGNVSTIGNFDKWNTSLIQIFNSTFSGCVKFNQSVGHLNVSNGTDFSSMFGGCTIFNNGGSSNINNWVFRTTGAILMANMFINASAFDQPIGNWNVGAVTSMQSMFQSALAFNQNIGAWNVSNVTNMQQMFNLSVAFNNGGSNTINNWNTGNVTNMQSMFQSASVFNQPLNLWNTSKVTNLGSTFYLANAFNQNIGAWDVSKVTTFASMFRQTAAFNNGGSSDINNWTINTSASVNMSQMFLGASVFNQPVGSWNTSAVTNMSSTFQSALAFNQNISSWNTAEVTTFASMFSNATAFNQNVGTWNVTKSTTFSNMFFGATAFNNGGSNTINNWVINTSNSVTMASMFQSATVFNQPLNSWNMSLVTDTSGMFMSASAFNQPLNNWNTANVTTMASMFRSANSFNQNIGAWNVSNVASFFWMFVHNTAFNNGGSSDINSWILKATGTIDFSSIFSGASAFNQPVGNWNTSRVTDMRSAFFGALAFNQNIGAWNVSNVNNFTDFMILKSSANFSTANLDAIYNGWSSRPVKPNITITFGSAKYTSASSAGRAILTGSPNNWVITDGGI